MFYASLPSFSQVLVIYKLKKNVIFEINKLNSWAKEKEYPEV